MLVIKCISKKALVVDIAVDAKPLSKACPAEPSSCPAKKPFKPISRSNRDSQHSDCYPRNPRRVLKMWKPALRTKWKKKRVVPSQPSGLSPLSSPVHLGCELSLHCGFHHAPQATTTSSQLSTRMTNFHQCNQHAPELVLSRGKLRYILLSSPPRSDQN